MKPCALLPLALLLFPSTAIATPPPALQDALSAAAAAAATPAVAQRLPAGAHARMVRRSTSAKNETRSVVKTLEDEAERLKDKLEAVVILPPGHFNHTVKFNGTTFQSPASHASLNSRHKRNFFERIEGHFGFGPSASKSAAVSKGTGAADAGKAASDDGRYYWYVEDSEDQKRWRDKDGKTVTAAAAEATGKSREKRDAGAFFEEIASEVATAGESSPTAGFTTSTRSAPSVSTTVAPSATSAAPAAATAMPTASGNSTDTAWYNPATWGTAISNSVSGEYNDVKHKLDSLTLLSKIGLAVLVLLASVLLFGLIYFSCRLNQRRRRRNAAERAQASIAANRPGGHGGRGGRSFDERATAIPVMGFVGSAVSTSKDKGKGKGKGSSSWSFSSRG